MPSPFSANHSALYFYVVATGYRKREFDARLRKALFFFAKKEADMSDDKKTRVRSPNYPALGLRSALEQTEKLFKKIHTHPAPRDVALQGLGYGSYNGASASAISAQLKYGLLMKVGEDYKVTERAIAILHPRSPAEKAEAIQAAARAPALFAEMLDQFKGQIPDDGLLRANLIRKGFAASAVAPVIQAFRETVELVERHPAEYDSVQSAESREEPMPVEAVSGPMSGARRPVPTAPVDQVATFSLADGERELLHGPLSRNASYRLVVRGTAGPKELGKLIKILELQKSLLEDDEDEEVGAED